MSDPHESDEVMLADPRAEDDFGARMSQAQQVMLPDRNQQQMAARQVGDLFGTLTTAQPVIKERDHAKLMQIIKVLAETFGEDYVYAWDVNDKNSKRADKKTTIEGPTINLTNDLAREYGNCSVEPREIDYPSHWVFYGRFTDLQTGYSLTRAFRQRKNAIAGKYEDDRKLDMAYQIGQSKCLRNVVVNALRNYVDYMVRIAKGALVAKIKKDPEYYLDGIKRGLTKFNIAQQSAEAMVGSVMKEWTDRDIAKVFSALKAVAEGLVDAKEAFPQEGPAMGDGDVPDKDVNEDQDTHGGDAPARSASGETAAAGPAAEATPGPAAGKLPGSGEAEPKARGPAKEKPKPAEDPKPKAKKPSALFPED